MGGAGAIRARVARGKRFPHLAGQFLPNRRQRNDAFTTAALFAPWSRTELEALRCSDALDIYGIVGMTLQIQA